MADEPAESTEESAGRQSGVRPSKAFWPFGQEDWFLYMIELEEKTLAAIDDLNTVVQQVVSQQAAVDQAVKDLVAAVQAGPAAQDPAIQAAVAQLQTVSTAQAADVAADPGAPPAPAPPA